MLLLLPDPIFDRNSHVPEVVDPLRRARGYLNAQNATRRVLWESVLDGDGKPHVTFHVPSAREPGVLYDVHTDDAGNWICMGCPDFRKGGGACKHIFEVFDRYWADQIDPVDPALIVRLLSPAEPSGYTDARRLPVEPMVYGEPDPYAPIDKKTGRKPMLSESTREDKAREGMDERVEEFLFECAEVLNVKHPFPREPGRRPVGAGDKVALAVLRAHHRKSYRTFADLTKRYAKEGLIPFKPCRQSLQAYTRDVETMKYLFEAFGLFAGLYREACTEFIVDASGISPFYVANWRDHQGAVAAQKLVKDYRPMTEWFKMHVAIDRVSKCIIGFEMTPDHGEGTGDASVYGLLLENLLAIGFENLRHALVDNIYLTRSNSDQTRGYKVQLVGPLKGRNRRKDGLSKADVVEIEAYQKANPGLTALLKRARSVIEVIFGTLKRDDNRLRAIGTKAERDLRKLIAAEQNEIRQRAIDNGGEITLVDAQRLEELGGMSAWSGLYVARFNEMLARIICQQVRRTVIHERKMNRRISLKKGHFFSPYAEYSPVDGDEIDPWASETDGEHQ